MKHSWLSHLRLHSRCPDLLWRRAEWQPSCPGPAAWQWPPWRWGVTPSASPAGSSTQSVWPATRAPPTSWRMRSALGTTSLSPPAMPASCSLLSTVLSNKTEVWLWHGVSCHNCLQMSPCRSSPRLDNSGHWPRSGGGESQHCQHESPSLASATAQAQHPDSSHRNVYTPSCPSTTN